MGIDMYYETGGEGEPLVLLHGGSGIGANWDLIFKEIPAGYYLFDLTAAAYLSILIRVREV